MIVPKLVALTANLPAVTIKGDAFPGLVTSGALDLPVVSQSLLKVTALIDAKGAGAAYDPHPHQTWLTGAVKAVPGTVMSVWNMADAGATLTDLTGTNPGALSGTYLRGQASLLPNGEGASTYLDAGGVVGIPPSPSLQLTAAGTVMCWAKMAAGNWNPLLWMYDGSDGYAILWQDSTTIFYETFLGTVQTVQSIALGAAGVPAWIAFAWGAGFGRLYVNGVPVDVPYAWGSAGPSTGHLAMGGNIPGGVYTVGNLQDCAVVNRALTPTEIAAGWTAANTSPTALTIAPLSSLTWNGDAMTLVKTGGSVTAGVAPEMHGEAWVLANPDPGAHTLTATHGAGTQVAGTRNTVLICELWENVDQTNPVDGSALASGYGSSAFLAVTSAVGEAVTDAIAVRPTFHPYVREGQFLSGFDTQGTGATAINALASHRDGDGVTAMGWGCGLTAGAWLELGLSLRGPDGPSPTQIPGAKIAGITLGGVGVPSRVISYNTLEQIKEMLLQTTQLYTSEHTITLANDDNCLVKLAKGLDWYGKVLEITVDGVSIWRGYIIAIQPDTTNATVNVTARSTMQKGAETAISASAAMTGTAINPADAILAILRKAFTDDQLDLAAIRLAGGPARAAGATIDYSFAAGSNVTAMSAVQAISALCGIAVYELDGLITARVWRPYDGHGSDLRFPITDANVREWGQLTYDVTMFNPGVDVSYTGGGSVAVDDRESARRNGLLDPATGKSLRRYAFSGTDVIASNIVSARYFGGLYLSQAGDRCGKLDVVVGPEFNGVALGDRFPVTQATRMDLNALPMEVYTIRQDLDRQQWTLSLREVFAA